MGRKSRSSSPDEFPLLRDLHLKVCEILGDGNCLFNALSDQIYGDQSYNREIRENVVQYMRDHANDFKHFVPVENGGGHRRNPKRKNVKSATLDSSPITQKQVDENFDSYLKRMGTNGTYGDNLEIRAFSQAYDTDVRIYNRANKYVSRVAADGLVRRTAHIALHDWEHYSSIRNINGPDTGLPNIINVDTENTHSSAPSTPASSFSSSGYSSVERDFDSEDEAAAFGPNKKARSPEPATDDADIPTLSLNTAPGKKAVKIILHVKPQVKHQDQTKPGRFLTAREHKAMKKQQQKMKSKERKKDAAISKLIVTSPPSLPPTSNHNPNPQHNSNTISGMRTLTI